MPIGEADGSGIVPDASSSVDDEAGTSGGEPSSTSQSSVEDETSAVPGLRLDVAPSPSSTSAAEGSEEECRAELMGTSLQPVYLAFAFDVSGSMGKLDEPWHDPELKWEPVVAATKAFFADPSSEGIEASLSFFPAEDDRCEVESYDPPAVPMTALPSPAFAAAIDDVTPQSEDEWRGGTPTLAVTEATLAQLGAAAQTNPSARHVFVLVSDGYPQGCDDEEDDIQRSVDAVAASRDEILTFVIGVQNPPGGPDAVTNLHAIAEAGGSETAFIVETDSAEASAAAFKAAIEDIRGRVASCTLALPQDQGGAALDPTKVNVSYDDLPLGYDPSCGAAESWRFDDEAEPTSIELCPGTCDVVRQGAAEGLVLEFGCERRPAVG